MYRRKHSYARRGRTRRSAIARSRRRRLNPNRTVHVRAGRIGYRF
jgi:hypothetical protein